MGLLLRRGSASVSLLSSQCGPLTWALWKLKAQSWSYDLLVAVVSRSPSVAGEELQTQWRDLATLLHKMMTMAGGQGHTRSMLPVVVGDFNAHTGMASEGSHVRHLPVRIADSAPHHQPHTPLHLHTGAAFLDLLAASGFMIVNNRIRSIPGIYSRQWVRGERVENSVIDYFLLRADDWSKVRAEGVWEDSGPLFASDHNMLFMDLNMVNTRASAKRHSGHNQELFYPPVFRGLFRVCYLRSNSRGIGHGTPEAASDRLPPREEFMTLLSQASKRFHKTLLKC